MTASPYMGSGPSTVWPPAIIQSPSTAASLPPRRTSDRRSNGRISFGQDTRFKANIGVPPIAYMSLAAFTAAIRPQILASSTIGAKKSVVDAMQLPFFNRQTAASSLVSDPTRRLGCCERGRWRNTCARSSGPSLQAQPAPWLYCVRRIEDMFIQYL